MKKQFINLSVALVTMVSSSAVLAAVSAEEAKQLGDTLTPWGAEKAGNKEGTIPAYGETIKPPADYDPNEPMRWPNPFKGEKPLFTITAQNMAQYDANLTEGQKAMFKKYPEFRMVVYPSHRTLKYPKWYVDNSIKNATACKTARNGEALEGCYSGMTFPIPKTGNEVMWNHLIYYGGYTKDTTTLVRAPSWLVPGSGKPVMQAESDYTQINEFYDPSSSKPVSPKAYYWKIRVDILGPARRVGEKILVLANIDYFDPGIRIWQYIPGQRRVKLAPDLAYDTPNPVEGGNTTMDQNKLFNGAQDRYNFKLIGKQEKFIQYHNYDIGDYKVCPEEKQLTPHFINPDCNRWELHRVWVVDATIKPGFRHIMPHRVFYFDEDFPSAGISDDYDAAGKMYRVSSGSYRTPYVWGADGGGDTAASYSHDLQTGTWSAVVIFGKKGTGVMKVPNMPATFYSPEALAGEGIR